MGLVLAGAGLADAAGDVACVFLGGLGLGLLLGIIACICAYTCRSSGTWIFLNIVLVGISALMMLIHLSFNGFDWRSLSMMGVLLDSIPANFAFLSVVIRFATLHKRLGNEHCHTCGHLLRGLTKARCPECGTRSDPSPEVTMSKQQDDS